MNNEQPNLTENRRIVTGKICEICNAIYEPNTTVCPKCGSTNLKELVTTSLLQEILAKKAIKEKKKRIWITLLICFLALLALLAYSFIRLHNEGYWQR